MLQCACIVMGVSGVGKSLIGRQLAARLNAPFLEGDEFHPASNVAKMRAGVPLDDADRAPWLDALGATIAARRGSGVVAACSALKRSYRERLARQVPPPLLFICLVADRALLESRLAVRAAHFMPISLLASQLHTLELPGRDEPAIVVSAAGSSDDVIERIVARLAERHELPHLS